MSERTCSVDGCPRPVRSARAEWCNTHYFRWYRTGKVGKSEIWDRKPVACSIDECERQATARGLCDMHYQRFRKWGDPHRVEPNNRSGPANHNWQGDNVTYHAAHGRVRRKHGSASKHKCFRCKQQARHWAYDKQDLFQLESPLGPYSTDPSHYFPACVSCHKLYDLGLLHGMTRICLGCKAPTQGTPRCPACVRAYWRAQKKSRPDLHTAEWKRIAKAAKEAHPWCARCGATDDLTVDHVAPRSLALGVQVLCRSCNSRKGARPK